jgi:hypothetical protein
VKKIKVHATMSGAYAHARAGFVPESAGWTGWSDLRHGIARRLAFLESCPPPEGALSRDVVSELKSVLAGDDPRGLWRVVDRREPCWGTTLGKALTMPVPDLPGAFPRLAARLSGAPDSFTWRGTLAMDDPACMARHAAYIESRPLARSTAASPSPF